MLKNRSQNSAPNKQGAYKNQAPKAKKDRSLLYLCLLFLVGALVLLYPSISNLFFQLNQGQVVQSYHENVSGTDQASLDAEYEEALTYNRSLIQNKVVLTDPFDPNAPKFPDGDYEKMLDISDAMAALVIPAIDVNLPVYHGTSSEVLEKGVGHLEGTSLPVGESGSHCVLSAHCGLPSAELFTHLSKLELGDCFYIEVLGRTLYYQVDAINVVEPEDTSLLYIDPNEDYVTLITCTPYGVNTHRLLVRGERVFPDENPELQALVDNADHHGLSLVEILQLVMFAIALLLLVAFIAVLIKTRKKKDDNGDGGPGAAASSPDPYQQRGAVPQQGRRQAQEQTRQATPVRSTSNPQPRMQGRPSNGRSAGVDVPNAKPSNRGFSGNNQMRSGNAAAQTAQMNRAASKSPRLSAVPTIEHESARSTKLRDEFAQNASARHVPDRNMTARRAADRNAPVRDTSTNGAPSTHDVSNQVSQNTATQNIDWQAAAARALENMQQSQRKRGE